MATHHDLVPTIVGDVPIQSVTVNTKGGSVSAILKQGIRGSLDEQNFGFGAKMEFEHGVSCVLVAPGMVRLGALDDGTASAHSAKFRVKRLSSNSYIVELEDKEAEEIDPMTKAVLTILEDQLRTGKTKILGDDEARMRIARAVEEGAKAANDARQKLKS